MCICLVEHHYSSLEFRTTYIHFGHWKIHFPGMENPLVHAAKLITCYRLLLAFCPFLSPLSLSLSLSLHLLLNFLQPDRIFCNLRWIEFLIPYVSFLFHFPTSQTLIEPGLVEELHLMPKGHKRTLLCAEPLYHKLPAVLIHSFDYSYNCISKNFKRRRALQDHSRYPRQKARTRHTYAFRLFTACLHNIISIRVSLALVAH